MAKDIVQQVKSLEAEADGIVSEAERRAKELQESVAKEAAVLREERERAFSTEMAEYTKKLEKETAEEIARMDENARRIEERLQSVPPDAETQAIELILKNLREV